MAELKPCPFCGGTKLNIDSKRTFQYGAKKHCSVTVRCMKCHARSPVVGINMPNGQYNEREICESAVIEAWNRRPPETVKVETSFYDQEETYPDCTVQVLTNTATGETSVGWWRNEN